MNWIAEVKTTIRQLIERGGKWFGGVKPVKLVGVTLYDYRSGKARYFWPSVDSMIGSWLDWDKDTMKVMLVQDRPKFHPCGHF